MSRITRRVSERLVKSIPAFQKVLASAKARDVNESDTVVIVQDMLADVFGYDKYAEITSEQAIRGTYCDLAVKLDGEIKFLIEVKAIGLSLNEHHLRQAIGYGAGEGIQWIVLTNGARWEIHAIKFEKPVTSELICEIDILDLRAKGADSQERLYLLCKESLAKGKSAIEEYRDYSKIVNRHTIAAIIQSDVVLKVIRRELRRMAPKTKISPDDISVQMPDVLKRDLIEGEEAKAAERFVKRTAKKALKSRLASDSRPGSDTQPELGQVSEGEA